jgi:hypothetical protein
MVHDVIDMVISILWTAIFIGLGIGSFVGLRNVVMFVRHKVRRGWTKTTTRRRVVSRRFGVIYLLYGLCYILLKVNIPETYHGWLAGTGYMLVLVHLLALRLVYEREMMNARS